MMHKSKQNDQNRIALIMVRVTARTNENKPKLTHSDLIYTANRIRNKSQIQFKSCDQSGDINKFDD